MTPEVFVKKVGAVWQLWVTSLFGQSPAGPRLEKGTTPSFCASGPPEFTYSHPQPQPAYVEAERLQRYLNEWNKK